MGEDPCELEVCEIREVLDKGDKGARYDTASLQGKVREGVLKSGVCIDPSERWEEP